MAYRQVNGAWYNPTQQQALDAQALIPYADPSLGGTGNQPDYTNTLPEGVEGRRGSGGYKFFKDGQRVDIMGNPYQSTPMTLYGTGYDNNLVNESLQFNQSGNFNVSPETGQFSGFDTLSPEAQRFLQQEAAAIRDGGNGVSDSSAFASALYNFNKLGSMGNGANANKTNLANMQEYIRSQNDDSFGSTFKKFAGVFAAPLALAGGAMFAPAITGALGGSAATGVAAGNAAASGGLGSILGNFGTQAALKGAITGGLGGLASGGDLSSALKGAAFGGVGGGFGNAIGGSLGLGTVGQKAFTGAITGAAGGLGSGNIRDAALGGLIGGGGGYLSAGGNVPVLGSLQQQLPEGVFGPAKPGTGILGGLQGASNTGLSIGGQPMKLGSLLSAGGDVYGYMQGRNDLEDVQNQLLRQSQAAQAQLNPYAQAGQTALQNMQAPSLEALQNDPGYQFRLQQGNQALERSLAAQGLGQSGAALKAAQQYGQGLADQTYNDYFNRQGQIAGQGFNAAQGLGSILQNQGNMQANASVQGINQRNQFLSNLLGGGTNDDGDYLQGSLGRLLGGLF